MLIAFFFSETTFLFLSQLQHKIRTMTRLLETSRTFFTRKKFSLLIVNKQITSFYNYINAVIFLSIFCWLQKPIQNHSIFVLKDRCDYMYFRNKITKTSFLNWERVLILPQWFLQISMKEKYDHIITVKWYGDKPVENIRVYLFSQII